MDNLSIESLLSIAIAIECNGAEFYRNAANMVQSPMKEEFYEMANMEDAHMHTFQRIKQMVQEKAQASEPIEINQATQNYLQSVMEGSIIDPTTEINPSDFKSLKDVIDFSINEEKDTIVFYQCLKSSISEPTINKLLDEIIQQEIIHMMDLNKRLTDHQQNASES